MRGKTRGLPDRFAMAVLLFCIVLQTAVTFVAIGVFRYPMSTQRDSWEYVNITDNVIGGHGFSVEPVAPWRPDSIRTPGMLLTNVPLRFLFAGNDTLAAVAGRVWLLASIILVIRLALEMGLPRATSLLAGAFLVVTPTIGYYTILVYETETPYLISASVLAIGLHRGVAMGRRSGFLLIGLASAYAIALRPAALVVLVGLALIAALGALVIRRRVAKVRLAGAAVCTLAGLLSVYVPWSQRNKSRFGTADYSAIVGINLLQYNAAGMVPHLDADARSEVLASVDRMKLDIHAYYGRDQLLKAGAERREGLRLIRKYWPAFVRSQVVGSIRSLTLFDVSVLRGRFGPLAGYAIALYQAVLTIGGSIGLVRWSRTLDPDVRLTLGLLVAVGLMSVATAGAVASPRFRFPLEIPLALGDAYLVCKIGWGRSEDI